MADLMTLLNSSRINRTYLMRKDIGAGGVDLSMHLNGLTESGSGQFELHRQASVSMKSH